MFHAMDADRDGFITKLEMKQSVRQSLGDKLQVNVQQMLEDMDHVSTSCVCHYRRCRHLHCN